ncbi:NeuD/PglB/VioB family sugar acetyltransferase [Thiomonas bhubaneswarensis]|uniref:Sugar O-acyltransferase, sialic acid O-acetyltransferase NeuD family n=1 Tax=Thiomonas bhubaneswarensis TaxID=339866 RepID=A0A0K6IAK6_9BURK|nr:NeuD/PglB/VioB family sugar acetyltransferase [Thiomonas bhubaneswarensis]CUB00362.1 sugar O-acyltransferase, sialic acid O-acetyltransferase NeuD family [Thiomonas bhubaneswarensis]
MPASFEKPVLIVFGAGGHGRVAADAALLSSAFARVVASDRNAATWGGELLPGVPVLSPDEAAALPGPRAVHVAIGHNTIRRDEAARLASLGPLATIVHPAASVAASARVAPGCLITAQCVVGPMAELGEGVIVNHGAVVDHDCRIAAWAHVAPGVNLGGAVQVGEAALVGAGSTVLRNLRIGALATLGAGAVLLQDLPDGAAWAGVPARPLSQATA